jgi:hypothetical protein
MLACFCSQHGSSNLLPHDRPGRILIASAVSDPEGEKGWVTFAVVDLLFGKENTRIHGKWQFVGASETWLVRHHMYAPTEGIRIMEQIAPLLFLVWMFLI